MFSVDNCFPLKINLWWSISTSNLNKHSWMTKKFSNNYKTIRMNQNCWTVYWRKWRTNFSFIISFRSFMDSCLETSNSSVVVFSFTFIIIFSFSLSLKAFWNKRRKLVLLSKHSNPRDWHQVKHIQIDVNLVLYSGSIIKPLIVLTHTWIMLTSVSNLYQ